MKDNTTQAPKGEDLKLLDSDIAAVEVLHDLLLEAHGYSLDYEPLKRARELTAKLTKMLRNS